MNYLATVSSCFLDRPGGSARVAWDIAQEMRDQGHHVTMACCEERSDAANDSSISQTNGIRILRYRRPKMSRWSVRRDRKNIDTAAQALRQELGNEKWDIVHMHNPFPAAGALEAIGPGPRYVYTVHSPTSLEQRITWRTEGVPGHLKLLLGLGKLRRLEYQILQQCHGIQALSEFTRSKLEALHRLGDKVTVIPHWCKSDLCRKMSKTQARGRLGLPEDGMLLFTLRRHVRRMGLDVAVKAIAPLARAGRCTFMIGGDGPMRPGLEDLSRRLGAKANQVIFTGRLSDEDLLLAYQAADLFVLPTRELECFGLITLEAMAFGLPVLGTDAGATPEILDHITPELVVAAGDTQALRDKVEAVLDGSLDLPSAEQLVAFSQSNYGRDRIVPRICAFLEGTD